MVGTYNPTVPVVPPTPVSGALPTGVGTVTLSATAGWSATSAAVIFSEMMQNTNSPAVRKPAVVRTGTELEVELPEGTTIVGIIVPSDNVRQIWINSATGVPEGLPLNVVGMSVIAINTAELTNKTIYLNSPTLTPDPEVDVELELIFL